MDTKEAAEIVLHIEKNGTEVLPAGVDKTIDAMWHLLERAMAGEDIRPLLRPGTD